MVVTVRELSVGDLGDCSRLQREIWGLSPEQAMSPITLTALMAGEPTCGLCLGAFEDGALVGLAVVLGTLDPGDCYGHMLGTLKERRDRGLGRRLLEACAIRLRERGLRRMLFTYEPLESRNAHLYLNVAGAWAFRYLPNHFGEYGAMHQGFPQDRFLAALELAGPAFEPDEREAADLLTELPLAAPDFLPEAPEVLVAMPADLQALKRRHPAAALALREDTRKVFSEYLNRRGHRDVRLLRQGSGEARRSFYLLRRRSGV